MTQPRKISILGVTGSIGKSTLNIIRQHQQQFELQAITAQNNIAGLIEIAKEFRPKMVAIGNESHYAELKSALAGSDIEVAAGEQSLCEAGAYDADMVVAAIVGVAGLNPTMAAIAKGYDIALANKECLVSAGELVTAACERSGSKLLPVDSEHNAIFQVLDQKQTSKVEKLTLTASGGPFRGYTLKQLENVTPEQAVAHPRWDMGAKISVDSASMMNKGLELIEAARLFPFAADNIDVVVHPESIIHSLVHYVDGSVLAQLGMPDMETPISYCLGFPNRLQTNVKRLNLLEISSLNFEAADEVVFPCLRLAREALQAGGSALTILNAANEVAVAAFLQKQINFTQIAEIIDEQLVTCRLPAPNNIEEVLAIDEQVRAACRNAIDGLDELQYVIPAKAGI